MATVINNGTFPQATIVDEVPFTTLVGDGGGTCPIVFVLQVSVTGLTPGDPLASLQIFPSGAFTNGVDINGNIGVSATFTDNGDQLSYAFTGSGGVSGNANFTEGVWAGGVRATLTGYTGRSVEVTMQALVSLPPDFTGPAEPPTTPTDLEVIDAEYNEDDRQEVTLSWTTDATEDGSIISVDDGVTTVVVAATPTSVTTEIPVVLPPGLVGPITIIVQTYIGPPGNISPTATVPLTVPANITPPIEGTLTIDVALAGTMQVIGDPSGIYVSVPGKTSDTLYERAAGTTTTQDVAIPRPFGKVTYVPESD